MDEFQNLKKENEALKKQIEELKSKINESSNRGETQKQGMVKKSISGKFNGKTCFWI